MKFNTDNRYKIFFKDGTSFESNGSSSGIRKSSVADEFKWVAFHIEKEVRLKGKTLDDIEKIEYNLNYQDKATEE